jgi:hypothetical protein
MDLTREAFVKIIEKTNESRAISLPKRPGKCYRELAVEDVDEIPKDQHLTSESFRVFLKKIPLKVGKIHLRNQKLDTSWKRKIEINAKS